MLVGIARCVAIVARQFCFEAIASSHDFCLAGCSGVVPLLLRTLSLEEVLADKAALALGTLISHPPHRAAIARMKGMTRLSHWLQIPSDDEAASGAELHMTQLMRCFLFQCCFSVPNIVGNQILHERLCYICHYQDDHPFSTLAPVSSFCYVTFIYWTNCSHQTSICGMTNIFGTELQRGFSLYHSETCL